MPRGREKAIAPRRRGVVLLLLLALVVVTAASVSQVWTRLKAIDYGYRISKASKEHAKLLEINRKLRIEVALLKRPGRIARIAREELGLREPEPGQVRRLRLGNGRSSSPALARAR
jgi:cell division protein FtsL